MQVPRCCFYCCFYFLALVYRKVLICIHFVFVPVFVFMIPSTLNNEHLSSKSSQMHQLVSELKCSGKVLHHNWKYISNKQILKRRYFSWATLNPVFGNVLRCRNTSGVSHSAYLQIKIHCCWMLDTAMVQNTNTLCLDAKYIIAQIHC